MYSRTLTPRNVTTVGELNILNQQSVGIIYLDNNSVLPNNESTIDVLISLNIEQQRVASYNAAQESAKLIFTK